MNKFDKQEYMKNYYKNNPERWKMYRQRHKERRHVWDATYTYGLTNAEVSEIRKNGCVICGVNEMANIHRIDRNQSHHKNNVICLCEWCHMHFHAKKLKTLEELLDYFIN